MFKASIATLSQSLKNKYSSNGQSQNEINVEKKKEEDEEYEQLLMRYK